MNGSALDSPFGVTGLYCVATTEDKWTVKNPKSARCFVGYAVDKSQILSDLLCALVVVY